MIKYIKKIIGRKLFIKKLQKKLAIINNKYENINRGGCGTFSYYLGGSLKDKYNIDPEIIYIEAPFDDGWDYDISFTHVMVKIDEYYIDSEKVLWYKNMPSNMHPLDIHKLGDMIKIPKLWNRTFDHSKSLDLAEDIYLI